MQIESKDKQAVLVFAREISLDLRQRGWAGRFRRLLEIPRFLAVDDADLHIFTSGACTRPLQARFPSAVVHRQSGSSFSESLEGAVGELVELGYKKIVIVGRDCPELTPADVQAAFEELDHKRLILGPDHNGGLYLIGLNHADRDLIRNVNWQRNSDFGEMASRVPAEGVFILPVRQDLDSTEDLHRLSVGSSPIAHLARSLLGQGGSTSFKVMSLPRLRQRSREVLRWQLPPPSALFT
jgi:glycosyltransferase A (GT-A) superfamily protein (DUF2064 family)